MLSKETGLLYEKESPYHLIQITRAADRLYLKFNEGLGIQSVHINDQALVSAYYDYYSILPYFLTQKFQDVLLIGAGGGTIPNIFVNLLADEFSFQIDAVEIDPAVIKAAQQYLDYPTDQVETIISDGRVYLNNTTKTYDIIIIDAYAQQFYIPFHLTTEQFFQTVRSHLKERAVVAININSLLRENKILTSITETMKAVFAHVYLVPVKYSANWLVMASDQPLDFQKSGQIKNAEVALLMQEAAGQSEELTSLTDGPILTDNRAPIEFYTEQNLILN